jgi:hypothetical protein
MDLRPGIGCRFFDSNADRRLYPRKSKRSVRASFTGGLHLVERQPELRHHRRCPRQGLSRVSLAEDNEVIGIVDDVRTERLATAAVSPMLEEAVHVDVGLRT